MSTKNPRVPVMLTHHQHEVLKSFAALTGKSMSAVCGEIIGDLVPVLEKLAAALATAKKAEKDVLDGWRGSVLTKLSPMEVEADGLRDQAMQLMHGLFEALEGGAAGERGARSATGSPAEPPSL